MLKYNLNQNKTSLHLNHHSILFFSLGFVHIARVGSIYTTVSIAIERFLSMKRQYSSETRFKSILVGFPIFFAITYNIPRFFELETIPRFFELETTINDTYFSNKAAINGSEIYYNSEEFVGVNDTTVLVNCTLNKTYVVEDLGYGGTLMRQNYLYIVFYIFWSKFIFIELIPWVTVFVLNLLIWKKVREFEAIRRGSLGIQSGMKFYCNIFKSLIP